MNATETPEKDPWVVHAEARIETIDVPEDLSGLTVAQLREWLDRAGIGVPKSAKKDALVEALDRYRERVRAAVAHSLDGPEEVEGEVVEDVALGVRPGAEIARRETDDRALAARGEWGVDDLLAQSRMIERAMHEAMREGHHYGKIPGVDKPTLLKPGAEKLCVLFRFRPHYDRQVTWHDDGHLTVISECSLTHITSGLVVGEGGGLCTSRETRYAYRTAKRVCPACGAEAIIKGKAEYGGGWLCWKKENGCGAKFPDGDQAIESQETGKVANDAIADLYNTILKMGDKRALVAAILNGTAASDVFTQDVEDAPVASSAETPFVAGEPTRYGSDKKAGQWIVPKDWTDLSNRIKQQLGDDAGAWLEELAEKAYAAPSIAAVAKGDDVERARDLWRRMNVVLRGLEEADRPLDGPLSFVVGVRQVIQRIVYDAFDQRVALTGPSWALDPEEAKTLPQRDGTPPPEATGAVLPAETAGTEDAPGTVPGGESGDDIDAFPF